MMNVNHLSPLSFTSDIALNYHLNPFFSCRVRNGIDSLYAMISAVDRLQQ